MKNYSVITPNVAWNPIPSAIEGGRRPTEMAEGICAASVAPSKIIPKAEVVARKPRRNFPAQYKLRILRELDACKKRGEKGLVMRREGLYSSMVSDWRKQCEKGVVGMLKEKRGRKAEDASAKHIAALEKENAALRTKLKQAEAIIDVQKKVSEMFGLSVSENTQDDQK